MSRIRQSIFFLQMGIVAAGCRAGASHPGAVIEFTRVPPAVDGGPDKLDIIEGRVRGLQPGEQIVLYAKNGSWWLQPLVDEPFTKIRPNSSWTNATHVGTDYAALLVEQDYKPLTTVQTLPGIGAGVVAVAVTKGSGPGVSHTLSFSGYEWRVRNAASNRGGVSNYDLQNASVDPQGALHLQLTKRNGDWTSAEVTLTRSLGYGTYSVDVRDIGHLESAAVFSMFTWDYAGTGENNREMDIEVSKWGDSSNKNAQFVVQPFYVPANTSRFDAPSGPLRFSFQWEAGRVAFRATRARGAAPVAEHIFTTGVPSAGIETVRLSLYVFRAAREALQRNSEVVVDKFEYLP